MKCHVGITAFLVVLCLSVMNVRAESVVTSNGGEICSAAEEFISMTRFGLWVDDGTSPSIQCFDVNDQGEIAIGYNGITYRNKCIGVYDVEGNFLYGYSFRCDGSFLVEWVDNGELAIYWMRGTVRATFDQDGKCIDYQTFTIDKEMNKKINSLFEVSRTIGNERYYLDKGDGFVSQLALNYYRVIHVGADGVETTVHSATGNPQLSGLFVIAGICFIAFTFIYTYRKRPSTLN